MVQKIRRRTSGVGYDHPTLSRLDVENDTYLSSQILTYLGNKRALLRFIGDGVSQVKKSLKKNKLTFFDVFSGSGIVSRFMKQHSELIIANDLELYSEIVNKC